jgi:hypothetical protein
MLQASLRCFQEIHSESAEMFPLRKNDFTIGMFSVRIGVLYLRQRRNSYRVLFDLLCYDKGL